MSGNTFGKNFHITTFGESHGAAVGVVIDGCPAGYELDFAKIQIWLDRRRPGQSTLTSPRQEIDKMQVLSGMEDGITLGTPLTLLVHNQDARPNEYAAYKDKFRPSHADYTTQAKFGIRAKSGGGRASARETIGRVAAAAVAEQILQYLVPGLEIVAYVDSVKDIALTSNPATATYKRSDIDATPVRCPDKNIAAAMQTLIERTKAEGDSVGGTITCLIRNCPVGLGEPVFDRFDADLGKAMLSLPATKGFEIGSGFNCTKFLGSEHNDEFYTDAQHRVRTHTNHSGGMQGGISNGETIYCRIAFKPPATISKTIDNKAGRHDPCVLPRAVPMVEAMATLVTLDHYLRQSSQLRARGPHAQAK